MSGPLNDASISQNEFQRLLERFGAIGKKVAVAVSGGPDSMALAYCVHQAFTNDCIAFIVDHGLREESPQEAQSTSEVLRGFGMDVEILTWEHPPIMSRVHERAREARYGLLTEACRCHGIKDLFVGHHADDQVETILMRLEKGSDIEGLAGIHPQRQLGDIRLLRPFLPVAKSRLLATCHVAALSYVEDPSNDADRFLRTRVRHALPDLAKAGLGADDVLALGKAARQAADALGKEVTRLLQDNAKAQWGSVRLSRAPIASLPSALGRRVLASCLRYVRPSLYPPDRHSLQSFHDRLVNPEMMTTHTLFGCLVSATASHIVICREATGAFSASTPSPGDTILWDRRWDIRVTQSFPATQIRALGSLPHRILDALDPDLRRKIPQGRLRASLPALWEGPRLVAVPRFDGRGPFSATYHIGAFP